MMINRHGLIGLLVALCCVFPNVGLSASVVLTADGHDGKDSVWKARYAAGKNSWGIDGTHVPINGSTQSVSA